MIGSTETGGSTLPAGEEGFGKSRRLAGGVATLVAIALLATLLPATPAAAADEGSGEITDSETPKSGKSAGKSDKPYALQASDPDAPKDPAVVAAKKKAAEEAALKKTEEEKAQGPSVYQKWQFWALTGAVVVAVVGAIIGGAFIIKSMNGGDVQQCIPNVVCTGEGRPKP